MDRELRRIVLRSANNRDDDMILHSNGTHRDGTDVIGIRFHADTNIYKLAYCDEEDDRAAEDSSAAVSANITSMIERCGIIDKFIVSISCNGEPGDAVLTEYFVIHQPQSHPLRYSSFRKKAHTSVLTSFTALFNGLHFNTDGIASSYLTKFHADYFVEISIRFHSTLNLKSGEITSGGGYFTRLRRVGNLPIDKESNELFSSLDIKLAGFSPKLYWAEATPGNEPDASSDFQTELRQLLNRYSKENGSNTPDFVLASYLNDCLDNFNRSVATRDQWYGNNPKPGQSEDVNRVSTLDASGADFIDRTRPMEE